MGSYKESLGFRTCEGDSQGTPCGPPLASGVSPKCWGQLLLWSLLIC